MYENITNKWLWAHFHFTVYCSFTKKPSSCEWHFSEMKTLGEFRKLSKQFQSRQLQWKLQLLSHFVWFSCMYPGRNTWLILNNFAACPQDMPSIKNVKAAVYHPPNCTSALQPPDFGFIKCFKQLYRKHTLKKNVHWVEWGTEQN